MPVSVPANPWILPIQRWIDVLACKLNIIFQLSRGLQTAPASQSSSVFSKHAIMAVSVPHFRESLFVLLRSIKATD